MFALGLARGSPPAALCPAGLGGLVSGASRDGWGYWASMLCWALPRDRRYWLGHPSVATGSWLPGGLLDPSAPPIQSLFHPIPSHPIISHFILSHPIPSPPFYAMPCHPILSLLFYSVPCPLFYATLSHPTARHSIPSVLPRLILSHLSRAISCYPIPSSPGHLIPLCLSCPLLSSPKQQLCHSLHLPVTNLVQVSGPDQSPTATSFSSIPSPFSLGACPMEAGGGAAEQSQDTLPRLPQHSPAFIRDQRLPGQAAVSPGQAAPRASL